MRSGTLRHRVIIQRPSDAGVDDYGQPRPGEADVFDTWAAIEPLEGGEPEIGSQQRPARMMRVTTRYFPGADSTMSILLGKRRLQVRSVRNTLERGRLLVFECEEQT